MDAKNIGEPFYASITHEHGTLKLTTLEKVNNWNFFCILVQPKFNSMESFRSTSCIPFLNAKLLVILRFGVHDFFKIEEGQTGTSEFLSNPKYNQYIYDCNSSTCLSIAVLCLEKRSESYFD